jgi:hypothetical protein
VQHPSENAASVEESSPFILFFASQTLHDRNFPKMEKILDKFPFLHVVSFLVGNIYIEGGNKPPCKKEISSSRKDAETMILNTIGEPGSWV